MHVADAAPEGPLEACVSAPSVNQERVLLYNERNRHSKNQMPPSLMRLALRCEGLLDHDALQQAINELVRRHPAFRLAFLEADIPAESREQRLLEFAKTGVFAPGMYRQFILERAEVPLQHFDFSHESPDNQKEAVEELMRAEAQRRFEHWRPPLLRACLFRLSQDRHILILVMDHLISDGFSLGVIKKDLRKLYDHFSSGNLQPPEVRHISFPEFVIWQNRALAGRHFEKAIRYWRDQWVRFSTARIGFEDFPFALPQTNTPTLLFDVEELRFSECDAASIRSLASDCDVTVFAVFLASFALVLSKYTDKSAVAIWTHLANRTLPGTLGSVGCFINSHILGIDLSANPTGVELLRQVRGVLSGALDHQGLPILHLWRALRCVPRYPDPMVLMDFGRAERPRGNDRPGSITIGDFPIGHSSSPRASSLGVYIHDDHRTFTMSVKYARAYFRDSGIRDMLIDLQAIILELVNGPTRNTSELRGAYIHKQRPPASRMGQFVLLEPKCLPAVELSVES